MDDFDLGYEAFAPELLANMGQFSDPIFSSGNVPSITDKNGSGIESVADSIGSGVSQIFYSFTNGISTAIDGMSDELSRYVSETGVPVSYDNYGRPIYQVRDPRTGAVVSTTTPSYYGGAGDMNTDPQRAITGRANDNTGFFGRLFNSLSYPNPVPTPTILSSPPDPRNETSIMGVPVFGNVSLGMALGVLTVGLLGFYIVKRV